ncbi:MAG: hypothetical protein WAL84_03340 [Candidatus Dormiibacterota bacterium]
MNLASDGVTSLFATNVLGHAVLLEGLLTEDRLGEVAVFVGSEAARGIPKIRMKRPSLASTSADELATVIDGSYFDGKKFEPSLAFSQGKYIGALWIWRSWTWGPPTPCHPREDALQSSCGAGPRQPD